MKYLIVNADDFGLTKGVSDGIIEACEYGVVRSTTMFANTEYFDYAVTRIKECPKIATGVHLTLTYGSPVSNKVPSLVNKRGAFFKLAELEERMDFLNDDEIYAEFSAQIDKVKRAGIDITHLDTHHHIHKHYKINKAVTALCHQHKIGIRRVGSIVPDVKTTELFIDGFHGKTITELDFKLFIKKHESAKSVEIMCHPGHNDSELASISSYAKKREAEFITLTSYDLQAHFYKMGIELTNFGQLPD